MKPALPIHLMEGDIALDQRGENVLVTFADGCTKLVINARLRPGTVQEIIIAARKPAVGRGHLPHFLDERRLEIEAGS